MTEKPAPPRPSGVHFQMFSLGIGSAVRWRLLSANNREMARGSLEYATASMCRDGIEELRASLGDLQRVVRRTIDHTWIWELLEWNGPPVAVGNRFDRQIRCVQALNYFIQSAPGAEIAQTTMVSDYRRWHSSSTVAPGAAVNLSRRGLVR